GQCLSLTVTYAPRNFGEDRGTLTISVQGLGPISLPITGSGVGPDIDACTLLADGITVDQCSVPAGGALPLDFGLVSVGASAPARAVRISNLGNKPLTLSFADVDPSAGQPGDFAVVAGELLTPVDPA